MLEIREVPALPGVDVTRRDPFEQAFKLLGVFDRGAFLPRLLASVVPVVIIADPAAGLERARFWGLVGVNAVAAQFSYAQLHNPVDSGLDVLVDRITLVNTPGVVPATWHLGHHNVALGVETFTDFPKVLSLPLPGGGSATAQLRGHTQAGSIAETLRIRAQADQTLPLPCDGLTLGPGVSYWVSSGVVNVSINVIFEWREQTRS